MFHLKLAQALVEHETLDKSEVEKVIRGEKIRQVEEKLKGVAAVASDALPRRDAAGSKPRPASRPQSVATA